MAGVRAGRSEVLVVRGEAERAKPLPEYRLERDVRARSRVGGR